MISKKFEIDQDIVAEVYIEILGKVERQTRNKCWRASDFVYVKNLYRSVNIEAQLQTSVIPWQL